MPNAFDLASLQAAYQRGSLTPLDVVDDIFARLATTPHEAVFIHEVSHARAREMALAVAARRNAGEHMRLFGIPFVVKDNIDVAGLPTSAACPAFVYVPSQSAAAVEHLIAEGAILIGKTNLDQFATGLVGVRSPYGIPRNPFDAQRVPGGSSSGSAVAVALGFCSFALATDTAGSGRVPAGFNNLVGLKPTRGMISARGVVPACRSLDCVAVFALNVADAAEVAGVMAGFDAADPYSRPEATGWDPRPSPAVGPFRFAVPAPDQLELAPPYSAGLFHAAVEKLQQLGGASQTIDMQPLKRLASMLYGGAFVAERLEAAGDLLETDPSAIEPTVRSILLDATRHRALDLFRSMHAAQQLRAQLEPLFDQFEFLLVPTAPTLPRVADVKDEPLSVNAFLGTYTNFVNLLDLCALAIPAGWTDERLPFGVTLVGRRGSDARLATFGRALERAFAGHPNESPRSTPKQAPPVESGSLLLAVVGAHLSGEPLNHQLTDRGAELVQSTRTAPRYRLFALHTQPPKPGLVRTNQPNFGQSIEVEVWKLSDAGFGSFMRLVGAPLCIGSIELNDSSVVHGFLCEPAATEGTRDISGFGGWRNFRRSES